MKALNESVIIKKYLVFLGYFSILLIVTLLFGYFYLKTCDSYLVELEKGKQDWNYLNIGKASLSNKIDSLNYFMKLLNTKQVQNEIALERSIIMLKNDAVKKITELEMLEDIDLKLQKTIVYNIEIALENKRNLHQAKSEEENNRKKLLECIDANKKMKEEFNK